MEGSRGRWRWGGRRRSMLMVALALCFVVAVVSLCCCARPRACSASACSGRSTVAVLRSGNELSLRFAPPCGCSPRFGKLFGSFPLIVCFALVRACCATSHLFCVFSMEVYVSFSPSLLLLMLVLSACNKTGV
uniref:Uncharacterized protein n=1 Tax=Triticum urartu TaxID=4572 RepID=A0A8R7R985_TRIUA